MTEYVLDLCYDYYTCYWLQHCAFVNVSDIVIQLQYQRQPDGTTHGIGREVLEWVRLSFKIHSHTLTEVSNAGMLSHACSHHYFNFLAQKR